MRQHEGVTISTPKFNELDDEEAGTILAIAMSMDEVFESIRIGHDGEQFILTLHAMGMEHEELTELWSRLYAALDEADREIGVQCSSLGVCN